MVVCGGREEGGEERGGSGWVVGGWRGVGLGGGEEEGRGCVVGWWCVQCDPPVFFFFRGALRRFAPDWVLSVLPTLARARGHSLACRCSHGLCLRLLECRSGWEGTSTGSRVSHFGSVVVFTMSGRITSQWHPSGATTPTPALQRHASTSRQETLAASSSHAGREPVLTAVRVRPFNDREWKLGVARSPPAISISGQTASVSTTKGSVDFVFDHVFWSHEPQNSECASQEDVFCEVGGPLLQGLLAGANGCLIAYGESGAGKSFSVFGPRHQPGVVPRFMDSLLQEKACQNGARGGEFKIWLSAWELNHEHVLDLLSTDGLDRGSDLSVLEHPVLGAQVVGAIEVLCNDTEAFWRLLDFASVKRAMSSSNVNVSARSSIIMSIRLEVAWRRCSS